MIQSQIVLHRFEAVVPCGLGSAQIRPSGGTVSPPRVPSPHLGRYDNFAGRPQLHNCLEVLQEDRLGCYSQYY